MLLDIVLWQQLYECHFLGILLYDAFVLIIVIFIFLSGINIKNFHK